MWIRCFDNKTSEQIATEKSLAGVCVCEARVVIEDYIRVPSGNFIYMIDITISSIVRVARHRVSASL